MDENLKGRNNKGEFKKGYTPWNYEGKGRLKRKYKRFNGKLMLNSQVVWLKYNNLKEVPKGFVIHHKDNNSLNDNIENLILMKDSDHKSLHNKIAGEKLVNHSPQVSDLSNGVVTGSQTEKEDTSNSKGCGKFIPIDPSDRMSEGWNCGQYYDSLKKKIYCDNHSPHIKPLNDYPNIKPKKHIIDPNPKWNKNPEDTSNSKRRTRRCHLKPKEKKGCGKWYLKEIEKGLSEPCLCGRHGLCDECSKGDEE